MSKKKIRKRMWGGFSDGKLYTYPETPRMESKVYIYHTKTRALWSFKDVRPVIIEYEVKK